MEGRRESTKALCIIKVSSRAEQSRAEQANKPSYPLPLDLELTRREKRRIDRETSDKETGYEIIVE